MKHFTLVKRWALLSCILFVGYFSASAQCTWTLEGFDSYGDGWNGGTLAITDNGVPVTGSPFAVAGSADTWTFTVTDGNTLELTWSAGTFLGEVSFNLLDNSGANVFSQPSPAPGGVSVVYTGAISCTPCAALVSGVLASGLTASSADINWNAVFGATTYTVEWGAPGFTPGTGTEIGSTTSSTSPANITGLTANTAYDVYVSSDCNNGWSAVYSFSLPCVISTPATLAWLEDFESVTTQTVLDAGELACEPSYKWDFQSTDINGRVRFGTDAITAFSGTGAATLDKNVSGANSIQELILTIDLSTYAVGSNLALNFDWMHHGEEANVNDRVWVRGSDTDAWIEVYDFSAIANGGNVAQWFAVDVLDLAIPLSNAGQTPSSTFQIRFGQEDNFPASSINSSDGITIDDVEILNITCPQPYAFTNLGADQSSAEFGWTEAGSAMEWQLEYGAPGFTPGNGTVVTTSTNPETINGLPANTVYEIYVRSICGPGDTSLWTGPLNFNTFGFGVYMEQDSDCGPGFIDISMNPGATNTGLIYAEELEMAMPFDFFFQGTVVQDIIIGAQGAVLLNQPSGTQVNTFNTTIANSPEGLYVFHETIDASENNGAIYYETIGTAPNRTFIVQWETVNYNSGPAGEDITFQVQMNEADGSIYYVYEDAIFGGSDSFYDNGNSATIGVKGVTQDFQTSYNDDTYLSNNSCAHYYYTDCPKPTNFMVSYTTTDEAAITWAAGITNETDWIVTYVESGMPIASGISVTTPSPALIMPGLDDITCYDVYIQGICAGGDTSNALTGTFCTLPNCANPTLLNAASATDSLMTDWQWTANPGFASTGFGIQYGWTGFNPDSNEGTTAWLDNNYTDTTADMTLISGGVYQVYVQAVCNTDSSAWVGPVSFTMPLDNDSTCFAEALAVDGTLYTFDNTGATVDPNETTIAPPATGSITQDGWQDSNVNSTVWYTFTAPASGNVRVNCAGINFDGQVAAYEVTDCADFNTFSLVGANDDAPGFYNPPLMNLCGLTPGSTYYLIYDSWSTTAQGQYNITLSEVVVEAGTDNGMSDICLGDTINLFDNISGNDMGGTWIESIPTAGFNDPFFNSSGLASQVFDFQYAVVDGCASDTVATAVEVYAPSSAGNDGTIVTCLNAPINLYSGLSGNVDFGGTWLDPTNSVTNADIYVSSIPGNFNYDYIAGNGVCPNDTANVIVEVDGTCNYLNVEELEFGTMELYPNPTTGLVYITNEGSKEVYNLELTDLNGKVITSLENAVNGTEVTEVSLENLETGVYLIRVYNDNVDKVVRVVKQ